MERREDDDGYVLTSGRHCVSSSGGGRFWATSTARQRDREQLMVSERLMASEQLVEPERGAALHWGEAHDRSTTARQQGGSAAHSGGHGGHGGQLRHPDCHPCVEQFTARVQCLPLPPERARSAQVSLLPAVCADYGE